MMKKNEAVTLLGIKTEEFELGALQCDLDPDKEEFTNEEIELIANLFGVVINSQKSLQPAIESGAITKTEAATIVQSRAKEAGYSLTTSEIDYLYENTALSFRALGKSLARIASENYQNAFDEEKSKFLDSAQENLEEFAIALKAGIAKFTPKRHSTIDFKKLAQENKGLFE